MDFVRVGENEFLYSVINSSFYIITGGLIKVNKKLQDSDDGKRVLRDLDLCENFLKEQKVFDRDSFLDFLQNRERL